MDQRKTTTRENKRAGDRIIAQNKIFFLFSKGLPLAGVSVKLKLFATLRKNYGVKELDVECDGTIFNLIENASKILGKSFFDDIYDKNQGKVRDNIIFMINGRNIKDLGEKIKLTDNDVVAIFPPIAGGRIFRGVKRDR